MVNKFPNALYFVNYEATSPPVPFLYRLFENHNLMLCYLASYFGKRYVLKIILYITRLTDTPSLKISAI